MMTEFSVLKGGNDKNTGHTVRKYQYEAGFSTDTRLMGVIGLELSWTVTGGYEDPEENALPESFRQIFYLDCEAGFIDTYHECYGPEDYHFHRERSRLISALGGSLVPLTEKEARFLIQSYSGIKGSRTRLPEGASNYTFLLFPEQTLNQKEYDLLSSRICSEISTPNFAVNYYLMRCASLDERGCAFMHGNVRFPDPDRIRPSDMPFPLRDRIFDQSSTLCLNKISHSHDEPDHYQCEALTERQEEGYFITNCELMISDKPLRINHAEVISEFHITDIEAAMILKRPEFISVCRVNYIDDFFWKSFSAFTATFTETIYDGGKLYIRYRNHNRHAGNSIYRINDDMESLYYLTESNQIIIMGYDSNTASLAEFHLLSALLHCEIYTENRYEFPEPVLYEFVNSGFDDFNEFLDFITDDFED